MQCTAIFCGLAAALALAPALAAETGFEPGVARELSDVLLTNGRDAEASCSNVDYSPDGSAPATRSPNPHGAVSVDVYVFVIAIDEIDATSSTFRFEGYGGLIWCDPRQAFDAAAAGTDRRVVHLSGVDAALATMWWPGVFLPSQLGRPERSNESLTIFANGTVEFTAKFNTRMLANYDFTDFPLDRQTLSIPIQAYMQDSGSIELGMHEARIGFDRAFELPEWWIRDFETRVDVLDPNADGRSFSRFVLDLHVGRKSGFYFWKVFLPIVIIVSISFSVFWMSRDVLAQRQRQVATGVLTLVAFQFVAAGTLPRVHYLTAMDALILWSFIVSASTMVFNVINKRRFREDEALGIAYDKRCRWLYPLVYCVGLVLISFRRYLM